MKNKSITITVIVAIVAVIGVGAAAGAIVHHNDTVASNHAMMMADAAQKKAVEKAMTDATMKQEAADKMAASTAMMKDDSTSMTETNGQ